MQPPERTIEAARFALLQNGGGWRAGEQAVGAVQAAMDPSLGDDMLVPLGWVKAFVRAVLCDEAGAEALVVEARQREARNA